LWDLIINRFGERVYEAVKIVNISGVFAPLVKAHLPPVRDQIVTISEPMGTEISMPAKGRWVQVVDVRTGPAIE